MCCMKEKHIKQSNSKWLKIKGWTRIYQTNGNDKKSIQTPHKVYLIKNSASYDITRYKSYTHIHTPNNTAAHI